MATAGHSVQNHSRSHPHLASLPDGQIAEQLSSTSDRVEQATGIRPSCFRPPYGSTSPHVRSVAANLGLSEVMWSTDTSDFERPGATVITARALADADGRPLNILMHDGGGSRSQTVAALGAMIDGLQAGGTNSSRSARDVPAARHGREPNGTWRLRLPCRSHRWRPRDSWRSSRSRVRQPYRRSRRGGSNRAGRRVCRGAAGCRRGHAAGHRRPRRRARVRQRGRLRQPAPDHIRRELRRGGGDGVRCTRPDRGRKGVPRRQCRGPSHRRRDRLRSPSSTVGLRSVAATRLVDTRSEPGSLALGTVTVVRPPAADAVFVNVTAVDPAAAGYLTAWPCDHHGPQRRRCSTTRRRNRRSPTVPCSAPALGDCVSGTGAAGGRDRRSGGGVRERWRPAPDVGAVPSARPPRRNRWMARPNRRRTVDRPRCRGRWWGRPDRHGDPAGIVGSGFLSLTPDGGVPQTSNLNASAGAGDVANFTAVAVGADGRIRVSAGGPVTEDVLLDIVGTFSSQPPP